MNLASLDNLIRRPTNQPLDVDGNPTSEAKPAVSLHRFQELEQHLRNAPADAEAYIELSEIYIQQGRIVDAKRVLDRGIENLPDDNNIRFHWEEAQLARSRQLLDAAEKVLAETKSPEAAEHKERCLIDLANLRVNVCQARLTRDPTQVDLLLPMASSLRQLGRHDEGVAALQKAVVIPELRARAALQLGMAMQQMGKPLEALAAYRRAALFRAPQPPTNVRDRALELAAELAEQYGLIESARRYVSLRLITRPDDAALKAQLERLQKLPL